MGDIIQMIEAIVEKTFAPAIDFKAPYAKMMKAKAAKDILAALSAAGYEIVPKPGHQGISHPREKFEGEKE